MFKTQNLYQNDPKWKGTSLGHSSETIGNWGCLLTSVTMMVNGMGYNETPETANDKMKSAGGFQEALFIPSAIPYVFPNVRYQGMSSCENSPAPIAQIDAAVAAGKPVILQVDWNKQAGIQTHFVLVRERIGDNYALYDPYKYNGDGPTVDVLLTKRYKFNGATLEKEISAVLWFDGYIPPSPPERMKLPLPTVKTTVYAAIDDLALRAEPSPSGHLWKRMIGGTELISLEEKATTLTKVGQQDKWLKVQDPNGDQGYVAAWYLLGPKDAAAPVMAQSLTQAPAAAAPAQPAKTPNSTPNGALVLTPTEEMSFRSQPAVSNETLIRRIPVTERLSCLEPANQAIPKVGVMNQWLKARDNSGKEGYLAAWYVKYSGGSNAIVANPTVPVAKNGAVKVKAAVEGVAFRSQPVVSDNTLMCRVPIDTEFTLCDSSAVKNIGMNDQWLKVKNAAGSVGYVAAWFVYC